MSFSDFLTLHNLKMMCIIGFCGLLWGYNLGFVAIYDNFNSTNENCTKLKSYTACYSVIHTKCFWNTTGVTPVCGFTDADCNLYKYDRPSCKANEKCFWDYEAKICQHRIGFTNVQRGLYAASMTVGGMIGSFAIGPIADRIGRKKSLIMLGMVGLIGSLLTHIARKEAVFAVNIIGRLMGGAASGMACHIAQTFNIEESPIQFKKQMGVSYGMFIGLGIWLADIAGWRLAPRDMNAKQHFETAFHVFIGVQTFISFFIVCTGIVMHETKIFLDRQAGVVTNDSVLFARKYTIREMLFPLFVATIQSIAGIITGIPAVLSYAPRIAKQIGMDPLFGNFIIGLFKFASTFVAVLVSFKISVRWMFITGCIIDLAGNLIVAVTTTPGVASKAVQQVVAFLGVILFIFGWQLGIGTGYYVLAQDLFPRSFRKIGGSYTLAMLFLMNIIVNFTFPIAVTNLSGGPSGNQNQGQSIVFYFFAFCNLVTIPLLIMWLKPFVEAPIEDNTSLTAKESITQNPNGNGALQESKENKI